MTPHELEHLLRCLHADRNQAGAAYNRLRALLIQHCAWKNHHAPEDGADAALDRVAAKLAAGTLIPAEKLESYCKEVARYICLEDYRRRLREEHAARAQTLLPGQADEAELEHEARQRKQCLEQLEAEAQRILRAYCLPPAKGAFADLEAERARLAAELGITLQNLRLRVHRWRLRLEKCLRERLQARG